MGAKESKDNGVLLEEGIAAIENILEDSNQIDSIIHPPSNRSSLGEKSSEASIGKSKLKTKLKPQKSKQKKQKKEILEVVPQETETPSLHEMKIPPDIPAAEYIFSVSEDVPTEINEHPSETIPASSAAEKLEEASSVNSVTIDTKQPTQQPEIHSIEASPRIEDTPDVPQEVSIPPSFQTTVEEPIQVDFESDNFISPSDMISVDAVNISDIVADEKFVTVEEERQAKLIEIPILPLQKLENSQVLLNHTHGVDEVKSISEEDLEQQLQDTSLLCDQNENLNLLEARDYHSSDEFEFLPLKSLPVSSDDTVTNTPKPTFTSYIEEKQNSIAEQISSREKVVHFNDEPFIVHIESREEMEAEEQTIAISQDDAEVQSCIEMQDEEIQTLKESSQNLPSIMTNELEFFMELRSSFSSASIEKQFLECVASSRESKNKLIQFITNQALKFFGHEDATTKMQKVEEEKLANLKKNVELLKSEKSKLEQIIESHGKVIQYRAVQLREQLAEMEKEKTKVVTEAMKVKESVKLLKKEEVIGKRKMQLLQKELSTLEETYQNAKPKILQERNREHLNLDALSEQLKQISTETQKMEDKKMALIKEITKLETQNEYLAQEEELLKSKTEEVRKTNENLLVEQVLFSKKIENLKLEMEDLTFLITTKKKEIEDLKTHHLKVKQEVNKLDQVNTDLIGNILKNNEQLETQRVNWKAESLKSRMIEKMELLQSKLSSKEITIVEMKILQEKDELIEKLTNQVTDLQTRLQDAPPRAQHVIVSPETHARDITSIFEHDSFSQKDHHKPSVVSSNEHIQNIRDRFKLFLKWVSYTKKILTISSYLLNEIQLYLTEPNTTSKEVVDILKSYQQQDLSRIAGLLSSLSKVSKKSLERKLHQKNGNVSSADSSTTSISSITQK